MMVLKVDQVVVEEVTPTPLVEMELEIHSPEQ